MKRLTLRLSDLESEALSDLADRLEMTKNDLVRQMLREGLEKQTVATVDPFAAHTRAKKAKRK